MDKTTKEVPRCIIVGGPPTRPLAGALSHLMPRVETNHSELARAYMASARYPAELVWRMFSDPSREYAFFVSGGSCGTEDVASRHRSYATPQEFRSAVSADRPSRIEVGAVHVIPPKQGEQLSEIASREIAVDIDVDSYDAGPGRTQARSCCMGSDFCALCWPLVTTAAALVDIRLAAIGCERRAWFYSGGRGMHCRAFSDDPVLSSPDPVLRRVVREIISSPGDPRSVLGGRGDEAATRTMRELVGEPGRGEADGRFFTWYALAHPHIFVRSLREAAAAIAATAESEGKGCDVQMSKLAEATGIGVERDVEAAASRAKKAGDRTTPEIVKAAADEISAIVGRALGDVTRGSPMMGGVVEAAFRAAAACMGQRTDAAVTEQPGHLLRAPMGIHARTGRLGCLVATERDPREIRAFFPETHAPKVTGSRPVTFDDERGFAAAVEKFSEWVSELRTTKR